MPSPNSPSSGSREDRPFPSLHSPRQKPYPGRHIVEERHVRIDGKPIEKPSEEVRTGSIVALPLYGRVRVLRVLNLPERRGPAPEARACYEEVGIDDASPAT